MTRNLYRTLTVILQINLANYCGSKRYFRPRGFSIVGASAPVAPAVPTPMLQSVVFVGWLVGLLTFSHWPAGGEWAGG